MSAKIKLGRPKEINSELNLTPFIDLLSTMVCFLLIAAVWLQVGVMEIKQSHGTEAAATPAKSLEMDLRFAGPTRATITVKRNGRRFKRIRVKGKDFPEMKANLDQSLESFLNAKAKEPIKISSLMVTTKPSVEYGQLVESLDVFRKHSISNIGIIPVQGGI